MLQNTLVKPYSGAFEPSDGHEVDTAYRIVADHARMMTVAIADGFKTSGNQRQ